MEKWSERARRHRERAEALRVIASSMRDGAARNGLLLAADDYEKMAARAAQVDRSSNPDADHSPADNMYTRRRKSD